MIDIRITTTTLAKKTFGYSLSHFLKLNLLLFCLHPVSGYPLSEENLPLDKGQGEVTKEPIIYYGGPDGHICRVIGETRYFHVYEDGYKKCTPNTCPRNKFGPFRIPGGCIVCCYPPAKVSPTTDSPTDNGNSRSDKSPDAKSRRTFHVLVSCLVLAVVIAIAGLALAVFYWQKYVKKTSGERIISHDNLGEQTLDSKEVLFVPSAPSSSTLDSGRASDESLDDIRCGY